jgi:integrase
VQYRVTEIVDGAPRRVQRSHRLCGKDDLHRFENSRAVKLLRDEFMLSVNTQQAAGGPVTDPMRIVAFWEQRYIPYCTEVLTLTGRPRKKPSTMRGFTQIWQQHLRGHFGATMLHAYEPHMGTTFLESLTATQGKATLRHIKALGGSLFKRAVIERRIKVNPWHDVQIPEDAVDSPATLHYTLHEAENIISALVDRVDCQLIIALICFLGLRPGEIEGLRWEDFDSVSLHIRRNVVRGILGTPKTAESLAALPLIDRVRVPLELWRQKSGGVTEGWLFPSGGVLTAERIGSPEMLQYAGGPAPMSLGNIVNRDIKPVLKAKKIAWKKGGLYCGRRGAGTAIIELSNGNIALGQALLRHKDAATTTRFYKKQISDKALTEGMKLLDA